MSTNRHTIQTTLVRSSSFEWIIVHRPSHQHWNQQPVHRTHFVHPLLEHPRRCFHCRSVLPRNLHLQRRSNHHNRTPSHHTDFPRSTNRATMCGAAVLDVSKKHISRNQMQCFSGHKAGPSFLLKRWNQRSTMFFIWHLKRRSDSAPPLCPTCLIASKHQFDQSIYMVRSHGHTSWPQLSLRGLKTHRHFHFHPQFGETSRQFPTFQFSFITAPLKINQNQSRNSSAGRCSPDFWWEFSDCIATIAM